ncbi:MAG: YciI family protein [Candidatus Sulfotelmatobacter sp.]
MKYLLLMASTKAGIDTYGRWPKKDRDAVMAFMTRLRTDLNESGELVSTEGLALPDQAKMVRAGKNGAPVTDGVFPESKEFLAGYWIVDVKNAKRAYEIAARVSAVPGPGGIPSNMPIEVRQIMGRPSEKL